MIETAPTDAVLLVRLLTDAGRTVAVAESLTGGAVTDAIVGVPGASQCLRGGVVAYATDLKASLLDVDAELLQVHGPVHADVARAMAAGVRRLLGADYGIATTGVAGPQAQAGLRPGTFHVAVDGPRGGHVVSVDRPDVARTRQEIRATARDQALALALRCVVADQTAPARRGSSG